jgi:hypothetical protein
MKGIGILGILGAVISVGTTMVIDNFTLRSWYVSPVILGIPVYNHGVWLKMVHSKIICVFQNVNAR